METGLLALGGVGLEVVGFSGYCTISTNRSHHASQGLMNWTNLAFVTHHKDLWTSSKVGLQVLKNLGALRQFYEQCGQKIRSVTHHHWSWTSVSVNYVRHASQGVNDRSKWYSIPGGPPWCRTLVVRHTGMGEHTRECCTLTECVALLPKGVS